MYLEFSHAFLFFSNLNCQINQNLILEEITSKAFNRQWYKQIISLFIHPNNIYLHILISWLIASIMFVLKSWQDSDFVDSFDTSPNASTRDSKATEHVFLPSESGFRIHKPWFVMAHVRYVRFQIANKNQLLVKKKVLCICRLIFGQNC